MGVGLIALCLVMGLVEEVVRIGHFCAFASTRATVATAFGTRVSDKFECHSIKVVI